MKLTPSISASQAMQLDFALRQIGALLTPKLREEKATDPPSSELQSFFNALADPLASLRAAGGQLNLWTIMGLRRDEVRNTATLAGLWTTDFGGQTSRAFLAAFLERATRLQDWHERLAGAYRVETEILPMGNSANRVDVVIETPSDIIGIEVKIDARDGIEQLSRYRDELTARAEALGVSHHLIYLAPRKSTELGVFNATWLDVGVAARAACQSNAKNRTLTEQLIVSFGDHVANF